MANLSDASVEIYVDKVGKEMVAYIEATKDIGDYVIVYDGYSGEVDNNGNVHIEGASSGRWSYENNLEGYFDPERVKSWLGAADDSYGWVQDEEQKNKYIEEANKQYAAYQALVEALKTTGGRVEFSYSDCDPAMDWMGTGGATLEVEDGEVVFLSSFDSEPLDISEYAEQQKMSVTEAIECLHGDVPADKWEQYLQECEQKGEEPKDPQTWYDEDFEWED